VEEKRKVALEKLWEEFYDLLQFRSEKYVEYKKNSKNIHAKIDAEGMTKDLHILMQTINEVKRGE